MEQKSIRVRIYGTEYPLKVDDENLTRQAAGLIDSMMSDIHGKIPDQPPITLAVLTALNITETLFKEQADKQNAIAPIEEKIKKAMTILDKSLEGTT